MAKKYQIKKVGQKYMLFDNDIGEFLMGYTFDTEQQINKFLEQI
jgi:hypothetical protein